jgi:phosphoribosylaminoimidazole (AIR) synthetase
MGIGFCLVVAPEDAVGVQAFLRSRKLESFVIGQVIQDLKHKIIFE